MIRFLGEQTPPTSFASVLLRSYAMTKSHDSQSGEAGHQGSDRQAGKNVSQSHEPNPEPHQASDPLEVKARSRRANAARKPVDAPDHLHPGPDRGESEKSLGAIHNSGQKKVPQMLGSFKKL
jgi:hypothetical protein